MSNEADLATVQRLLISGNSIPVQLRMHDGIDEDAYIELTSAIERLIEHYASRSDVPKTLALAFVDIGTAFDYAPGAYPEHELERIEDIAQELSRLGQMLFSADESPGQ